MKKAFKNYILEIVVFVCGASVMILELAASRILAPFFGTNTFIWTSLIGIILGCLSIGYWLGGKYADRNPSIKVLANVILGAAFFVGIIYLFNLPVLDFIENNFKDVRIGAILGTILLFAVPSILLGMVSPYAAKLRIVVLDNSGATIGKLYSFSTMGSIVGTFLAGFFLIPTLGTQRIIVIVGITLLLLSVLISMSFYNSKVLLLLFFLIGCLYMGNLNKAVIDVDTQYSRTWIFDGEDEFTGRKARYLFQDRASSSAMFLDDKKELVFEYTKAYDLAFHFQPKAKTTLMIGGAAYSYPKYFLDKYPVATMDVVEIDPKITSIAKKYFGLKDNPNLSIFHLDGRIFLNNTNKKYDVVFGDAFKSWNSLPFHLCTKEAMSKIYDALNPEGVLLINVISAIDGEKGKFLRSEYYTCKEVFPQVYVIPIQSKEATEPQNIMIVALKSKTVPSFVSEDDEINKYLKSVWMKKINRDVGILTDDFSPVENYSMKLMSRQGKTE